MHAAPAVTLVAACAAQADRSLGLLGRQIELVHHALPIPHHLASAALVMHSTMHTQRLDRILIDATNDDATNFIGRR